MTAQEKTPELNPAAGTAQGAAPAIGTQTTQGAASAITKRTDRRSLLRSALGAAAATAGVGVLLDTQTAGAQAADTPMGNFGQSTFKSKTSTPTVTVTNTGSGGGLYSSGYYGLVGTCTSGTNFGVGVYGYGNTSGNTGSGTGVFGTGLTGVVGAGDGSAGTGVQGNAYTGVVGNGNTSSGTGVSGSGYTGVSGSSPAVAGVGVQGTATAGGDSFGVYGNGYVGVGGLGSLGVYGVSANSGGYGVYGYTQYDNDNAIYGVAGGNNGTGVYGSGTYGVYGQSGISCGVYGSGVAGVYGNSTSPGGVGASGLASGAGVTTGVYGYSSSSTGYGVFGESNDWAGYFAGNVDVVGSLSKSGGTFKIDHPLAPADKYLYHSFVESPDMMNIYSGRVTLDGSGRATVTLPDWFDALNAQVLYQLTAIGGPGAGLYIAQEVSNNRFAIAGGTPGLTVCWQVTGIRQDAWANAHRVEVEVDKPAEERGTYLHPELFGAAADQSIPARRRPTVPQAPTPPQAPQRPTVPAPAR